VPWPRWPGHDHWSSVRTQPDLGSIESPTGVKPVGQILADF
jgi:hypothetical protein